MEAVNEPRGSVPSVTVDAGRAVIRLNRPDQHNRIEPGDLQVLRDALVRVEKDESVRVVILRGSGRSFCSGFDLSAIAGSSGENGHENGSGTGNSNGAVLDFDEIVGRLESCRAVTICGLNGPAYGGGADLALACDVRIGLGSTHVRVPASRLGIHYYHGGLRRFVARLGLGPSVQMLLLSQRIDAEGLLRIGFLNEIVATDDMLDSRMSDLADTVIALPDPAVVYGMKRALNRIAGGDLDSRATDAAWEASVSSPRVALAAAQHLASRFNDEAPN